MSSLPVISRILVATDFSADSFQAIECAVTLAKECQAHLTFLHVVDVTEQNLSGAAEDLMKGLWEKGSAQMGKLAWELSKQVKAQTILEEGLPWEVIVEKSQDFDLLLLGPSRERSRYHFFSHRTVQKVIKEARCPVVVARGAGQCAASQRGNE